MPQLPRHSGDRNRTSPFAFTGNKFEFRAVGSTASIAWPNTVLNTIVAESLDHVAGELEKAAGAKATPEKVAQAAIGMVRKLIHEHKRIIFDGDNYSAEWHEEAKRRGLPILQDSVEAFPVLNSRKTADLFKKYGVLNKAEVDSRYHISVEKWVKQLGIEADTMGVMARTLILPAALEHQRRTAEALAATTGAGVEDKAGKAELTALVKLITEFRVAIDELEAEAAVQHEDPMAHARHIKAKVRPAMAEVRRLGDLLQLDVAADLWPMPVYRELLFLK
jgi:glutamine synthetase